MDDVKMMGETTFVWSSPISLPQDLPSVEPFEDGDRSYSDDSSEVKSTITQEGIMSSSGTISSSASSTGHTINTSASTGSMMAMNSSLSPVVEAEEEEAEEMISSADKAPPTVLLRLNAPQIEHRETPRGSTRSSDKRQRKPTTRKNAELDTTPKVVKSMDSGFFDELPTATYTTTTAPAVEVVETQVDCATGC